MPVRRTLHRNSSLVKPLHRLPNAWRDEMIPASQLLLTTMNAHSRLDGLSAYHWFDPTTHDQKMALSRRHFRFGGHR
jgi:hypothetical protein